tara:strand:+ start:5563 stop:6621 length:1059 start_codon:yes stop_codon:yes gene_type:complete
MKKMFKFPSIDQFRTVVSNINRHHNFVGLDENGDAIYDPSLPKPVLTFKGTVKLHGTNAAVSFKYGYDQEGSEYWAQSRENIITPEKDNAGFAFFVESKKEIFKKFAVQIGERNLFDVRSNIVTIYGEWCGGNIQKNVGISNLPKSFFIFGIKVSPVTDFSDEEENLPPSYWIPYHYLSSPEDNIYNIDDFPIYSIDIDFNMPQLIQNELSELTIAVEDECPVAKAFGFSGIGEGIVWSTNVKGIVHRFKVKGEKHSSSKVKTLASVDVEKLGSIQKFVEYAVTESRFKQSIENVFPNDEPIDTKKLGDVIRWVINDVIKEEMDTMVENGIEPKDVNKYVSTKVRDMFFKLI